MHLALFREQVNIDVDERRFRTLHIRLAQLFGLRQGEALVRNKEQKFSLLRNDHKKTTERDVLFAPISSSVFGYAQLDGSLKHYFSVIAESMSGDDLLELIGDRDKTIINNINTKILQIDPGFQIDVKKNCVNWRWWSLYFSN